MLAAPTADREALFRTLDLESTFGFFQAFCDWVDREVTERNANGGKHDTALAAVAAALSRNSQ